MQSDINGCSTCPTGAENYETFTPGWQYTREKKTMVQYDYRHTNGKLFSTVADTLEICRQRRDEWLKNLVTT